MKKRPQFLFTLLNILLVAVFIWGVVHLVYAPAGMSLELTSNMESVQPGETVELRYVIRDPEGEVVQNFDRLHEKLMHLIVVRDDLTQFQHVHPEMNEETGEFSVSLTFDWAGAYHLFADFTSEDSASTVLSFPVVVSDSSAYETIALTVSGPEPFDLDGLTVTPHFPESILTGQSFSYSFDVASEEKAVDLEDYLGAKGHSVVLHEGDLTYTHTHPKEDALSFEVVLKASGLYKSFTQFQVDGRIYVIEYVFNVVEGDGTVDTMEEEEGHK